MTCVRESGECSVCRQHHYDMMEGDYSKGDLAGHLPSVDLLASDDEEGSEAVFTRSDHIKSLGLFSEEDDLEITELADLEPNFLASRVPEREPAHEKHHNNTESGQSSADTNIPDGISCVQTSKSRSWDDFKREFDEAFQTSEAKVLSGQFSSSDLPNSADLLNSSTSMHSATTDIRHELIIEMITSLHDSREAAAATCKHDQSSKIVPPPAKHSPTRSRKQLLSMSTLETIHESEIDRLLESIESSGSNQHRRSDSDFFSLTDSDTASPSSPHVIRGEWGLHESSSPDNGNDELMKELLQLSIKQADGHQGLGEVLLSSVQPSRDRDESDHDDANEPSPPLQSREDQPNPRNRESFRNQIEVASEEKGETVVLDLRQSGAAQDESEGSDDEDDAYLWARQRRLVKENIVASSKSLTSPPRSLSQAPVAQRNLIPLHQPHSIHSQSQPPYLLNSSPLHSSSQGSPLYPSSQTNSSSQNPIHHPLSLPLSPPTAQRDPNPTSPTATTPQASKSPSSLQQHTLHSTHKESPSTNGPGNTKETSTKGTHRTTGTVTSSRFTQENDVETAFLSTQNVPIEAVSAICTTASITSTPTVMAATATTNTAAVATAANTNTATVAATDSAADPAHTDNNAPAPPRHRSSDSLTLSSSFSDSELTSSGSGTCIVEATSAAKKETKPSSSGNKKSKKQARKSKKSQKTPRPSKEKSERSLKRKAHIIQRIRNDSWNTSSDEDNSLTPLTEAGGSLEAMQQQQLETVQVDVEKVRADLWKRILSKKPPAQFETPATDPIYHKDESFGEHMVEVHPSLSPTGLLILPLIQHGLTSLPAPWSQLNIDALVVLHCLVLTWLMHQAAVRPDSKDILPFHVVGLQQTLLEGHLSLLVALHSKSGAKSIDHVEETVFNGSAAGCFSQRGRVISESEVMSEECEEMEEFLSSTLLCSILKPILSSPISDAIPSSLMLSLKPVLSLPLTSLFSYQDDITPLTTPLSFYWSSIYHLSSLSSNESLESASPTDTTVTTLDHTSLSNPHLVYTVLSRVFSSGFDLAGLRLLFMRTDGDSKQSLSPFDSNPPPPSPPPPGVVIPILALALRGPNAVSVWADVVGPEDSTLARVTDPTSLSAVFGFSSAREGGGSGLVRAVVRNAYQTSTALAKWFGGRACLKTATVFGMSDARTKSERRKRQRVRFSESESEDGISSPLPDMMAFPPLISNLPRLIAQAYAKCLLVVSPAIPPSCYSLVLTCCSELGFDIFGAKRIRLNAKRASAIGIPGEFQSHFTPSSTPPSPLVLDSVQPPLLAGTSTLALPPLPSLVIVVGRENAILHSTTLKRQIVRTLGQLAERNDHIGINSCLLTIPDGIVHLDLYSEEKMMKVLGSFAALVSSGSNDLRLGNDDQDELREELCFVAVPGVKSLSFCIDLLNKIFNITQPVFSNSTPAHSQNSSCKQDLSYGCFELVGMRIIPQLSRFHAKKLCPIPTGESLYSQAVQLLSDQPATLLVFRGMRCNKRVLELLSQGVGHTFDLEKRLQFVISHNLAEGIHFASLFFSGKDLFSDNKSRMLIPYLPETWAHESDILQSFSHLQEKLFSVVMFPLAQVSLAVKVLNKLSRSGFAFAGISIVEMDNTPEEQSFCAGSACIVVCVEKVNGVWLLEHILHPFIKDTGQTEKLKYSTSFGSAISDLRYLFPGGIYVQEEGTVIRDYNIQTLREDNFDRVALSEECLKRMRSSSNSLLGFVSPLLERTAVILPSSLFTFSPTDRSSVDGFIYVLDLLHQTKFFICGMKLVLFSSSSAKELQRILSMEMEEFETLTCGPCLVLILERDNAASCFQLIMRSGFQSFHGQLDNMVQLVSKVIAPSDCKQATELLSFFYTS